METYDEFLSGFHEDRRDEADAVVFGYRARLLEEYEKGASLKSLAKDTGICVGEVRRCILFAVRLRYRASLPRKKGDKRRESVASLED